MYLESNQGLELSSNSKLYWIDDEKSTGNLKRALVIYYESSF
jgi:hypothetical protein